MEDRTAKQQGWDCGGLKALEKAPLTPSQKEEAPRPSGLCILRREGFGEEKD